MNYKFVRICDDQELPIFFIGLACVPPSCPQFIVMGPLFHFLKAGDLDLNTQNAIGPSVGLLDFLSEELLNSVVLAVICCAMAESCISYGSQTLNVGAPMICDCKTQFSPSLRFTKFPQLFPRRKWRSMLIRTWLA